MDDRTIQEIVGELQQLVGRTWGKIFQLTRLSFVVDFRPGRGNYLLVSADPNAPRIHLIERSVRELEKLSQSPSPFFLLLRKILSGAVLIEVSKLSGDRIVLFRFEVADAADNVQNRTLVVQLTGRTSNVILVDETDRVIETLRALTGAPPAGERYQPPEPSNIREQHGDARQDFQQGNFSSLSAAADAFYRRVEGARLFDAKASNINSRLTKEINKRRRLLKNLARDIESHGDADEHKRIGDLLLANISTAIRKGRSVRLQDYYAEGAPTIELEIDEDRSLQEEAKRRFTQYGKARRAAQEISKRITSLEVELSELEQQLELLADTIKTRDPSMLDALDEKLKPGRIASPTELPRPSKKKPETISGVRRYRSTDGYEILVGRGSRDNDHLTFRLARSNDTWLHAADYPGSHVVIRNHQRDRDVPQRTVIEAAQLAAQFSQARKDAKVAVNYTLRKFVSKPKAAAPGLVRLSSFRTMLVEPSEALERF